MFRLFIVARCLVVASLVAALAAPALAADASVRTGGEYVIAFTGPSSDALAAIRDAGGTVLSVNEAVGAALVSASSSDFVTAVQTHMMIIAVGHNQAVGTSIPSAKERFDEQPEVYGPPTSLEPRSATPPPSEALPAKKEEPLNNLQWDMQMIGANANGAHREATGRGVLVGIIDGGVDGNHPDLKQNFDRKRSRNFVTDIPAIDGPCEDPTCVDPVDVDNDGHGTHVAGTIAAKKNNFGIAGVAPNAKIVNIRAGQDSGYFFLYETVNAITYAADAGIDVVNMSFYTDPWLFNCTSADQYLFGAPAPQDLADQALARQLITAALEYAHAHGVTLIAAAGNDHVNLALPTRTDNGANYPAGAAAGRTVTNACKTMPSEGPHVLQVSSVGPSTTKADYSTYGYPNIAISAPGGWFRDFIGTPQYRLNANLILSTYPVSAAIDKGLADADGNPTSDASVKACNKVGKKCGFYSYLQGTSMAAPHVTGVVALIVERHGVRGKGGKSLAPDAVAQILFSTATDHACPAGGTEDYVDEGRPADFNAVCDGSTANNGLYGEGIVNALAAVQ